MAEADKLDCATCAGGGLIDTSGFGDLDACEDCHGSGKAAVEALAASPQPAQGADTTISLTQDEISFVLNELFRHARDFEPECPTCTAYQKLRAAQKGTHEPQ
jgi:hypothetical protein